MKIESDIPLPDIRKPRKNQSPINELLEHLGVGQSVFVKGKRPVDLGSTVYIAKIKTGFGLTARTVDGGCRIWRTK